MCCKMITYIIDSDVPTFGSSACKHGMKNLSLIVNYGLNIIIIDFFLNIKWREVQKKDPQSFCLLFYSIKIIVSYLIALARSKS